MAARRDPLTRYWQKRDFNKTPEPKGTQLKKKQFGYLIQKHAATRLHYDFRLELDGVLKSWALTRGPSLDPHDKRLAVEVEDHPVSYGSFEGTIPKGQYGGGTVMLWDVGTWEPIGDPHKGLKSGKLEFRLHGSRLHGEWKLVRMRDREKNKGRHNWLLIKRTDKEAKIGDGDALLKKNATSIASGRTMEKIASDKDRVWKSEPKTAAEPQPAPRGKKSSTKVKKHRLPPFIPPQLATLTDAMPQGEGWVHEVKFDGYRALAYINSGEIRLFTRTGLDWTHKFGPLAERLAELPVESAILDGEIVALNEDGVSSFKALQETLSEGTKAELQYYAFDLLYVDGERLTRLPLIERKARLGKLFGRRKYGNRIIYSEHFADKNEAFLQRLCGMKMEGVISKRADAPYSSGRGKAWLKTKCHMRQEFVIGGFTNPTHAERGIGALLIGYYKGGKFFYAGRVGTGFSNEISLDLRKKLERIAQKQPSFESVTANARRGAHWVKPKLVCEVEFTEWTADGRLRHPSFQGLREDKPAPTIHRDKALAAPRSSRAGRENRVEGIAITHPDRIIYPGTGITKLLLAEYYAAIAEHILPHVKNRPLSMMRCPEGTGEPCFFQRHIARGQSPHLYETDIPVKGRTENYMMIRDVKGLISLAQWGVIELHPWGCTADKPDTPDRIIFDLDPDPSVPWRRVVEAAKEIRARLHELKLESFLKTTGGKGLHVTVPLTRSHGWPEVKAFARAIADSMQQDNPKLYISKASKAARKGKIFVDYLRNEVTATAIAPFSARAREGATVALTLPWEVLKPSLESSSFTIATVPPLLAKRDDPWEEFFSVKQRIPAAVLRALRI